MNKEVKEGEQTTLRYNYLMNASSFSQGDFVKTSGSYANQMRMFQANIESLTTGLGQAVIPIIQAVLPWINMFAQALIGAATTFTKWIDGMLGIKAQAISTATSSDTLAASQNNVATGINNVAAAATAAKKAVSGIDELNIFQKNTTSGSISSADANPVAGDSGLDTSGGTPTPTVPNLGVKIIGEAQLEAFKKAMGQAWNWIGKFHDGIISVASVIGVFFLPAIAKSIIELGTESVGAFTKGINERRKLYVDANGFHKPYKSRCAGVPEKVWYSGEPYNFTGRR